MVSQQPEKCIKMYRAEKLIPTIIISGDYWSIIPHATFYSFLYPNNFARMKTGIFTNFPILRSG